VPYDDFPETDEPLIELENTTEENPENKLWHDNSYMLNLISENTVLQLDAPKSGEKIPNLPDTLKGLFYFSSLFLLILFVYVFYKFY
jgi:hypothetical protein